LLLLPVIFTEFFIAHSNRVGSFNEVVAQESVAGFDAGGVLLLEDAGLVPAPRQTRVLGDGGLILEPFNIAEFAEQTGCIDFADAGH